MFKCWLLVADGSIWMHILPQWQVWDYETPKNWNKNCAHLGSDSQHNPPCSKWILVKPIGIKCFRIFIFQILLFQSLILKCCGAELDDLTRGHSPRIDSKWTTIVSTCNILVRIKTLHKRAIDQLSTPILIWQFGNNGVAWTRTTLLQSCKVCLLLTSSVEDFTLHMRQTLGYFSCSPLNLSRWCCWCCFHCCFSIMSHWWTCYFPIVFINFQFHPLQT